jgi:anaerobic magnesium-protoporphyrin IX monomethyl ester cyclase
VPTDRLDLLLHHAYVLVDDPREQEIMRPFPPLGLQYLVAWLRRAGFAAVDWWDATFSAGWADFLAHVSDTNPRVVGVYGHTITRPLALKMTRHCAGQDRRVIAGGPDPVQYLDAYLDAGVEVVVVGEGERTLEALMQHLTAHNWRWDRDALHDIPGIAFRHEGRVVRTAARPLIRPLDSIPWPARERRDLDPYLAAWRSRHGETAVSMVTSRGCPYHCTWCSKQVYGDTFRRRQADAVLDELAWLRETWDPDQIWFADDLFTVNRRWVHSFANRMVERGLQTPFYLVGRPENINAPMVSALRAAGLTRMYLSAESGAQSVLDAMRKDDTVEDIRRASGILRAHGVELGVFVMLGYPGETTADVDATTRMLHDIEPDVTLLSVAHPMKGTAFYEEVKDRLRDPGPQWIAENGGRLPFEKDYPDRFYEAAQRVIWNETGLVKKLRRGEVDAEALGLAARWTLWRSAARWYGTKSAR